MTNQHFYCALSHLGRSLEQELLELLGFPGSFAQLSADLGLAAPSLRTLLKQRPDLIHLLLGDITPDELVGPSRGLQSPSTQTYAEEDSDQDEQQLLLQLAEEDPLQLLQLPEVQHKRYQKLQSYGHMMLELEERFQLLTLQGPPDLKIQLQRMQRQLDHIQMQLQEIWSTIKISQWQQQALQQQPQHELQEEREQHNSNITYTYIEMNVMQGCSLGEDDPGPSEDDPAMLRQLQEEQAADTFQTAAALAKRAMQSCGANMCPKTAAHDAFAHNIPALLQQHQRQRRWCSLTALVFHAAAGTAAELAEHMQWRSQDIQQHLNFVRQLLFDTPNMPNIPVREQYAPEQRWSSSTIVNARTMTGLQAAEEDGFIRSMDVSMLQPFILWDNEKLRFDAIKQTHKAVSAMYFRTYRSSATCVGTINSMLAKRSDCFPVNTCREGPQVPVVGLHDIYCKLFAISLSDDATRAEPITV